MGSNEEKADKQYEELSKRQQALVDVLAEHRQTDEDATANEILEEAGERSGTDPYNRSYLYEFKRRYEDIIDERTQLLANKREKHDGSVSIEIGNNSYEGPQEGLDTTSGRETQTIDERPVKGLTQPSSEPEDGEVVRQATRLQIDLTDAEAFEIIRHGNVKVAEAVFKRIIRELEEERKSNGT